MKFLNLRVLFVLIYSLSGQLIAQESQWGDKKSGFKLCYRFDSETAAVYQLNYEQKIEMNMNGQPMNADKVFDVGYSLKSPGKSDNNWVQLSVTLDTFTAAMVMDIGKQSYDTRHLIGKKFEMHLPPKGGEIKISAPAEIPELDLGEMAGGSVGIDEFIKYGFPALSVQQVKKGAKWNAAFQRTQLEGSIHVTAKMEEVYRLAGYETVDDLACVKIESQIKGILNGSESQYGSQWTYTGKLKGKATWYFSYEEGLLVKLISNETTEGTISTQGENAVSVPTKQKTKVEIRLRR